MIENILLVDTLASLFIDHCFYNMLYVLWIRSLNDSVHIDWRLFNRYCFWICKIFLNQCLLSWCYFLFSLFQLFACLLQSLLKCLCFLKHDPVPFKCLLDQCVGPISLWLKCFTTGLCYLFQFLYSPRFGGGFLFRCFFFRICDHWLQLLLRSLLRTWFHI